jgi:threonine dehydrogenase-like Zn-dependent dehydrogenase
VTSQNVQAVQVEVTIVGSALGAHPGAEVVGVVRSTADAARHLFGRAVIVPRFLPCGECDLCRRGRIANCKLLGARPRRPQPRETLPARFLLPLEPPFVAAEPDAASLHRYAALADGLLAPYAGFVRAGVTPGTLCLILGGGPRSALSVIACQALGARAAVLCSDAAQAQALLAPPYEALGAIDANLDDDDAKDALRQLCDGAGLPDHGICLLETTGSDAGRARALGLLGTGGTAVLLDRPQPLDATETGGLPADLDAGPGQRGVALLERLTREGCQILGAGPAHPDLLPELLALVLRTGVDLAALTRSVSPPEIDAVMAARRSGRGSAAEQLALPIACFTDGDEVELGA